MRDPVMIKVQVARKQMALHDDDYRAILRRIAGVDTSSMLKVSAAIRVLDEFRRLGWKDKPNKAGRRADKPHVRKVYAMWGALDRAGGLRDASPAALRSFCQRQTGVASPDWLTAPQANAVTEALKAMLARVTRAGAPA